jgi:hypothetical protein
MPVALLALLVAGSIPIAASAQPTYPSLPLTFEPAAHDAASFVARGAGHSFVVSAEGGALRGGSDAVKWRLVNAKRHAQSQMLDILLGRAHYFVGSDPSGWRTDVPLSTRVRFAGVYPGISLIYYGNQRRLEYDFIVEPGADPKRILIEFTGVRKAAIDGDGDLVLTARDGELRQKKPVAYQMAGAGKQPVESRYVLGGNNAVAFELGDYDRSRELIIDPVLLYSSYFGGTGDDQVSDIAISGSGIHIAGSTQSNNFAGTSGYSGNTDAFVTKLSPDGMTVLYAVYMGGGGPDAANGLFVDAAGNAYVGGSTSSTNFPTASGAFLRGYRGGASDGFVAKLNAQGNSLEFSTYLGGFFADSVGDVGVDGSGNVYAVGETNSNDFPATFGAFQSFRIGADADVFVTKLNPQGSGLVYSTFAGGILGDVANGVAVASDGSAYVAGTTASVDFPVTAGAFQVDCGKATDAFLMHLNATGTGLVFSSCLGGNDEESGNAVALDSAGNAYLVGGTESGNFVTSDTAFQRNCGDDADAFVTKWNQSGTNLFYSTCLVGSDDDTALGVAVEAGGVAVVTGQTESSNFPVTSDRFHAKRGDLDAFVTRLNGDGSALLSSTFLGGDEDDAGRAVALEQNGNAWIAGVTDSNNFLVAAPSMQRTRIGGTDIFLSRIRFGAQPSINPNGIVNAATFQAGIAPLGLATIFGADLARGTETASGTPLPGALGGTEVW